MGHQRLSLRTIGRVNRITGHSFTRGWANGGYYYNMYMNLGGHNGHTHWSYDLKTGECTIIIIPIHFTSCDSEVW